MAHHDASLYVVATPIGNLKDITLRALEVLGAVDFIVSENVRKTRNLLEHYKLSTRVVSYREENATRAGELVIDALKRGQSVALVAEAGTPGVSDPGRLLVRSCWDEGLRVVPVPGASALVAAASVAGLEEQRLVFEGFLPRRAAKRRQRLRELSNDCRALVLFEAPHRLLECLEDIKTTLGDRQCIVCRELTKLHEEVERGTVTYFLSKYVAQRPLGEFVIICRGWTGPGPEGERESGAAFEEALGEARTLVKGGLKKTQAAKAVESKYKLRRGEVYRALARGRRLEAGEARD